jgi:hypothetical protein
LSDTLSSPGSSTPDRDMLVGCC